MAKYWLLVVQAQSLVIVPLMLSVAVAAPQAVRLLFGSAWEPAGAVIQVLSVVAIEQVTFSLVSPTWLACGKANWEFRFALVNTLAASAAFVVGANFGILGVAFGNLVVIVVLLPIKVMLTLRLLDMPATRLGRALSPALAAGVAYVVAAVATARVLETVGGTAFVTMALGVLVGLMAYGAVLLVGFRSQTASVLYDVRASLAPAVPVVAARGPAAPELSPKAVEVDDIDGY
jgi:O-antigen/teichoic acid export membrane protein